MSPFRLPFVMSVALSLSALAGLGARAAECTSPASCARQLACPPGFSVEDTAAGRKGYCKGGVAADTDTPTCVGKGPLPKPWKWDASVKANGYSGMCVTYDGRGVVSDTNPDAITCKSGYTLDKAAGKCERPASTVLSTPTLASDAEAGMPKPCAGASACTKQLACAAGYDLKQHAGPKFYCTKDAPAATAKPTCVGKGPLPKPWKWDASVKANGYNGMCVTYDGKGVVSDTNPDAITCGGGFDFDKASGLCEKPAGTWHATPTLD